MLNEPDKAALLRVRAALERAEAADPNNPFVASCRRFYEARGFLSTKQLEALNKVTPHDRRHTPVSLSRPPRSYPGGVWRHGTDSEGNTVAAVDLDGEDEYGCPDIGDAYGLSNSWDWAGGD